MLTIESSVSPPTGVHVVKIAGDADFSGGETLERFLHGLAAHRPRAVVLEFSGTRFMGSLAIGILVSFRKKMQGWGGKMALAGLSPGLDAALRITRLTTVLTVYPTLGEAEAAVTSN
ncbi:MAG: STAS domain-containing protein [Phycisphaerales bacterium]